jgi:hypothetical protein
VVGNTAKNVGEPRLRIDAVEFCCFDQGAGDCRRLSAALGPDEEIVFPAQGNGSHGSLGRIVIQLQKAVIRKVRQAGR